MNGNSKDLEYAARLVHSFHPPPSIDAMVEAFAEHCENGGRDFLDHLRPWHMVDALEAINDAANGGYTPETALNRIREALGELIAIAVIGHRQDIEQEEADRRGPECSALLWSDG